SHPHISTGLRASKFGVPYEEARSLAAGLADRRALRLVAVHVHVGSQITTIEPLRRAAAALAELAAELARAGAPLEYVDAGGGLGISYDGTPVPSPEVYAAALLDEIRPTG